MSGIFKVVGPPGCGKTTWLSRQCQIGVGVHGSEGVLVASLTRAAAQEAAGRNTGLARGQIGTMHAFLYRALGRPKILTKSDVTMWNNEHPDYAMTPGGVDLEESNETRRDGDRRGDDLIRRCDMLRARAIPREQWPNDAQAFDAMWSAYKAEADICDFTDLIERGIDAFEAAPGRPGAIFIDEAQDLCRLELNLVEQWSQHCDTTVLVGDESQALYSWRGATPDVLAGQIHKVLDQSYRVPAAVHKLAMRIIRATGSWREEVVYHPRRTSEEPDAPLVEGSCGRAAGITWRRPEKIIDLALAAEAADESLMILATCDYLLAPTKRALAEAGIPWHNPFSNRYNPISQECRASVEAAAYLGKEGSTGLSSPQLKALVKLLRSDEDTGVRRGGKAAIERLGEGIPQIEVARAMYRWLGESAYHAIDAGDLEWLLRHLPESVSMGTRLAIRVALRSGMSALTQRPHVILGTIHSVKGGEADRVLLFPDLSPQGYRQLGIPGWDGKQSIFRTFYVGATRAKEQLLVADPHNQLSIPLLTL